MRRVWTCTYAYDCTHYWRWTAVLCKRRHRLGRSIRRAIGVA